MARILVIDDDVQILLLIRTILEKNGHIVCSAPDGQKGMELFKDNRFELVITDMIMPHRSGLKTISGLFQEFSEVKIIAISGGGAIDSERYLALARSLGVHNTLTKPFTPDQLLHAVNEVLHPPDLSDEKQK